MKTNYELRGNIFGKERCVGSITIYPKNDFNPRAFIKATVVNHQATLNHKDLERFAVNILKALKSKKLKS